MKKEENGYFKAILFIYNINKKIILILNKNLKKAHALFGGMCFMENKFKNQILSEDLQNQTIENKEEAIKHGEEEEAEDTTRYGEFVTSYFAWVPMSKQKENVKRLENITKKREK